MKKFLVSAVFVLGVFIIMAGCDKKDSPKNDGGIGGGGDPRKTQGEGGEKPEMPGKIELNSELSRGLETSMGGRRLMRKRKKLSIVMIIWKRMHSQYR